MATETLPEPVTIVRPLTVGNMLEYLWEGAIPAEDRGGSGTKVSHHSFRDLLHTYVHQEYSAFLTIRASYAASYPGHDVEMDRAFHTMLKALARINPETLTGITTADVPSFPVNAEDVRDDLMSAAQAAVVCPNDESALVRATPSLTAPTQGGPSLVLAFENGKRFEVTVVQIPSVPAKGMPKLLRDRDKLRNG